MIDVFARKYKVFYLISLVFFILASFYRPWAEAQLEPLTVIFRYAGITCGPP